MTNTREPSPEVPSDQTAHSLELSTLTLERATLSLSWSTFKWGSRFFGGSLMAALCRHARPPSPFSFSQFSACFCGVPQLQQRGGAFLHFCFRPLPVPHVEGASGSSGGSLGEPAHVDVRSGWGRAPRARGFKRQSPVFTLTGTVRKFPLWSSQEKMNRAVPSLLRYEQAANCILSVRSEVSQLHTAAEAPVTA